MQFDNSVYDRRGSPIDDLQGYERTKYSKGYNDGRSYAPRPGVEEMRMSREGMPPRGTDNHFFSTLHPTRPVQ